MPPRSPKKSKPNPTSTDGTDASAAAAIPITYPPPPSVRLNTPLYESYSYYSCSDVPPPSSADELLVPTVEGEGGKEGQWMIGVDEAGRGPVLGPQVYGIAFCRVGYGEEELGGLGFADSKTLTTERRSELLRVMMDHGKDIKWAVTVMSSHDISRGMLSRSPYNLNAQSHDVTMELIRGVLERGYEVTECYVDTVGIAADYQKKLEEMFPTISFVVTSKADSIYPVVSAASIAAKVTRDEVMEAWTFLEPGYAKAIGEEGEEEEGKRVFGSGYPGDPKTIAWLEDNVQPIFGFPNLARFSWQTVKTILGNKGLAVKWNDEPASIQRYFSAEAIAATNAKQVPLWRDYGLSSVSAF